MTTVSPLLGRILSLKALPTCGWEVVDGATPARFEGWGENRREVEPAKPKGVKQVYFELLGNWISRDEFAMINDAPLVVSTWDGDE